MERSDFYPFDKLSFDRMQSCESVPYSSLEDKFREKSSAAIMRRRGSKSYSLQSSPFRKVAVQPMMPFVRRGFSE
jgi:hypothetical protein